MPLVILSNNTVLHTPVLKSNLQVGPILDFEFVTSLQNLSSSLQGQCLIGKEEPPSLLRGTRLAILPI